MHDQGRFYSTYDLKNINIALMVQQCPCLMREQVVQFSWIFFSLASSQVDGEKLKSKAAPPPSSPPLQNSGDSGYRETVAVVYNKTTRAEGGDC